MADEIRECAMPDGATITVGRSAQHSELSLTGADLEGAHVKVTRAGQDLVVKDLQTVTGTFRNGESISRGRVGAGEELVVGHYRLRLSDDRLVAEPLRPTGRLVLHDFSATHEGRDRPTIAGIDLDLPHRGFLAVVGPSGAGKSTLAAALVGDIETGGMAVLGAEPLGGQRMPNPTLVSFVAQRSDAIPELTPRQALHYTAQFRLAADLPAGERAAAVQSVLDRLDLSAVADQPSSTLSGGQLRRLSIARELLTEPLLMILDEPTSGLDEGLDRRLMLDLAEVADQGCTILLITHSMAHVSLASHVLAIASGAEGEPATAGWFGPSGGLLGAYRADSVADVMEALRRGEHGAGMDDPIRDADPAPGLTSSTDAGTATATAADAQAIRNATRARAWDPGPLSAWRSFTVSLRRELFRLRLDWKLSFALAILAPALVGIMAGAVSSQGLGGDLDARNRDLPTTISVLVISLAFISMALSLTRIVTDLSVLSRERRWGVRAPGALLARAVALAPLAISQAAVAPAVLLAFRPGPERPLPGWPAWPTLTLALAGLTVSCMALGLLISVIAGSPQNAVGAMSGILAAMVILNGTVLQFGTSGKVALNYLSRGVPTRWATNSIASYTDLKLASWMRPDRMWSRDVWHVLYPIGILAIMTALFLAVASIALNPALVRHGRRR